MAISMNFVIANWTLSWKSAGKAVGPPLPTSPLGLGLAVPRLSGAAEDTPVRPLAFSALFASLAY